MKIAVLGSGMVGKTLAPRLVELGHEVVLGTRDPEATLAKEDFAAWAAEHPAVTVATFADAAASAELVLNATNGDVTLDVLTLAGADNLAGKVLVDISNGLDFSGGFPPLITFPQDDSMGEQIQRAFPDTLVVKSLNTLTAPLMADPSVLADPGSVFVSGDDVAAKKAVTALLHEFGHTDVIDLGDITTARAVEWMMPAWLRLMGPMGTHMFNWKIVR
jgi:8-hydroxy-5-deazaflavin:NADPH oxidoreductase